MFLAGEVRLGQDVLKKVQKNREQKYLDECAAKKKAAETYAEIVKNATAVIHMMSASGKQTKDLKNAELKALLLPIKQKDKMPTLKKDMIQCYELWHHRPYLSVNPDEMLIDQEGNQCNENEDMEIGLNEAEEEEYEEV